MTWYGDLTLHRVYAPVSLIKLLSGLKILALSYTVKRKMIRFSACVNEAECVAENAKPENVGIALITLIVACKEKR